MYKFIFLIRLSPFSLWAYMYMWLHKIEPVRLIQPQPDNNGLNFKDSKLKRYQLKQDCMPPPNTNNNPMTFIVSTTGLHTLVTNDDMGYSLFPQQQYFNS